MGGGWIFDYFVAQQLFAIAVVYAGAALLMLPLVFTHRPANPLGRRLPRDPRYGVAAAARARRATPSICCGRAASCARVSPRRPALFAVGGVMSVIGIRARARSGALGSALISEPKSDPSLDPRPDPGALLAGWFRETTLPERTASVGALLAGVAIAGMDALVSPLPMCIWACGAGDFDLARLHRDRDPHADGQSAPLHRARLCRAREALIKAAFVSLPRRSQRW